MGRGQWFIMFSREEWRILDILASGEYMTAADLAAELGCSSKTVRSRIKNINRVLNQAGTASAEIESKPRFGFRLAAGSQKEVRQLLSSVKSEDVNGPIPSTPGERTDFLLFYLLGRSDYITIAELSEALYVSESGVKTALKNTESILGQYGIEIKRRPGYGILAYGEETSIRDCLVDLFMEQKKPSEMFRGTQNQEMERLAYIVQGLMKEQGVSLTEMQFYNFLKYIYISVRRIRLGREIKFAEGSQVQIDRSNIEFVECLREKLEEYYPIQMSADEQEYLAIHLAGKRTIGSSGEGNLVFREELNNLVQEMVETACGEFNLDLRYNFDLLMLLNQHMVPLDIRLKYNIPLVNPLLSDIQKNYPFAYTIAERTSVILQEHYKKEIPMDETGYLALIFALALEEQQPDVEPSNILIVCSSGKGSSQLLTFKYRQEFGKYINKIEICNLFELGNMNFDAIDYVFTTVPIKEPVPVPVYEVNLFLDSQDIANIRRILGRGNHGFLRGYFSEKLFFEISGNTKEQAIHHLCQACQTVRELPEGFEESVLHRERLSTTDYGNLAAMPHPYKAMSGETFVAVGILSQPIDWGRNVVQAVFMISVGSREDQNIQRFYQETMRLLMDESAVQDLINKKSLDAFLGHA